MTLTSDIINSINRLAPTLDNMGIPGLLALLLLAPVLAVFAVFALDYFRQQHRNSEAKADRGLIRELVENHRNQTLEMFEKHRTDTDKVLRDLGDKHAEVAQYYRDNVELVKITQHLATDMQAIIINNTRALEKLIQVVKLKNFAP